MCRLCQFYRTAKKNQIWRGDFLDKKMSKTSRSINIITAKKIFSGWLFWVLLIAAVASNAVLILYGKYFWKEPGLDILLLLFAPYAIVVFYVYSAREKIRSHFWKEFAELNGWQHRKWDTAKGEERIIFNLAATQSIKNTVAGIIGGEKIKIFDFEARTSGPPPAPAALSPGKYSWKMLGLVGKTFYFTIFAFELKKSFPHFYLNNLQNFNIKKWKFEANLKDMKEVDLGLDFKNKFRLLTPKETDGGEALVIFNEKILSSLSESETPQDIELINDELLIIIKKKINSLEELKKEFEEAVKTRKQLSGVE